PRQEPTSYPRSSPRQAYPASPIPASMRSPPKCCPRKSILKSSRNSTRSAGRSVNELVRSPRSNPQLTIRRAQGVLADRAGRATSAPVGAEDRDLLLQATDGGIGDRPLGGSRHRHRVEARQSDPRASEDMAE